MNEEIPSKQIFADFYNNKALKHSAFIVLYYIVITVFTLSGFENGYSISFYLNLIFLLVYTYAEEGEIYYSAPSLKRENKSKALETSVLHFCFFTWALVFEFLIFGLNSSKLMALYSFLGGMSFVGAFVQLPFHVSAKTKSLLVYFSLIWFVRLGILAYLAAFISTSIFGDWSINLKSPFTLIDSVSGK